MKTLLTSQNLHLAPALLAGLGPATPGLMGHLGAALHTLHRANPPLAWAGWANVGLAVLALGLLPLGRAIVGPSPSTPCIHPGKPPTCEAARAPIRSGDVSAGPNGSRFPMVRIRRGPKLGGPALSARHRRQYTCSRALPAAAAINPPALDACMRVIKIPHERALTCRVR